ncbi:hypothetical protein MMC13_006595 [Lambiella insularis]|nr:hypothetical protein [Lambiella insularis]
MRYVNEEQDIDVTATVTMNGVDCAEYNEVEVSNVVECFIVAHNAQRVTVELTAEGLHNDSQVDLILDGVLRDTLVGRKKSKKTMSHIFTTVLMRDKRTFSRGSFQFEEFSVDCDIHKFSKAEPKTTVGTIEVVIYKADNQHAHQLVGPDVYSMDDWRSLDQTHGTRGILPSHEIKFLHSESLSEHRRSSEKKNIRRERPGLQISAVLRFFYRDRDLLFNAGIVEEAALEPLEEEPSEEESNEEDLDEAETIVLSHNSTRTPVVEKMQSPADSRESSSAIVLLESSIDTEDQVRHSGPPKAWPPVGDEGETKDKSNLTDLETPDKLSVVPTAIMVQTPDIATQHTADRKASYDHEVPLKTTVVASAEKDTMKTAKLINSAAEALHTKSGASLQPKGGPTKSKSFGLDFSKARGYSSEDCPDSSGSSTPQQAYLTKSQSLTAAEPPASGTPFTPRVAPSPGTHKLLSASTETSPGLEQKNPQSIQLSTEHQNQRRGLWNPSAKSVSSLFIGKNDADVGDDNHPFLSTGPVSSSQIDQKQGYQIQATHQADLTDTSPRLMSDTKHAHEAFAHAEFRTEEDIDPPGILTPFDTDFRQDYHSQNGAHPGFGETDVALPVPNAPHVTKRSTVAESPTSQTSNSSDRGAKRRKIQLLKAQNDILKQKEAESARRAEEARCKREEHDHKANAEIELLMQEQKKILQAIDTNNEIETEYLQGLHEDSAQED